MATWDGSYSGPDDQNYYMYPDHTIPGPATGNWTYFPSNTNNDYSRSNRQFCVQKEPALEQNSASSFSQLNSNIVPSLVSATNNYPEHLTSSIDKTQELSTHERFPNSAKPDKYWNHNHDARSAKAKHNSSKKGVTEATQSTINQSKLRVMAEDFVPHNIEVVDVKYESLNVESASNTNRCVSDHSESSDKYFFNNTSKYERKYNNKKGYNHRPREGQQDQFYKGNSCGKSYQHQGRTSNRCQGNKYFANRYYSDKLQVDSANMNRNLLGASATNAAPCNSKNDAVTNTNDGESSLNAEANLNKNKHLWDEDNREETIVVDNDNIKENAQDCNNQAKELGSCNPGLRHSYSNYRNVKKYPHNVRSNREENFYKEKRRNHQGYNRENYNKEIKSSVKDHDSSNGECSEFKQCSGIETGLETKGKKEKRYKNYGYKGLKDNSRESKAEAYTEKEKSKYYTYESKEKVYEQWRSKRDGNERSIAQRWAQNKKSAVDDDANQRERLVDQLNRGHLECLVCCEYIKQSDYIWSCCNCYHVLHLKCVKKWAKSSQAENGWRCPACQNVSLIIPEDYFCFCGKTRVPEWNRQDVAHSCGEICGRTLSKNTCPHKCTLLCHPGSCPLCTAMVTKHCGCGKTSQTVQCSMHKLLLCDSICGKDLNCGSHKCEGKCHHGECLNCDKTITQECYCGKHTREVTCEANIPIVYSCEAICGKLLECGNHTCKKLCHADACEPCSLTPENITTCCCGQTALTEKRETCLDSVPTCDKICSKNLKCGQPDNPHKCKVKCHQGDCPVCDLTTEVKCRCGNMDREIACKDLTSKADDARCEKRCTKKRSCGKHKCNQLCCIEVEHICPLICSKTLSCGRHKCEQSCHKGRCQPCWRSSFDELYCECGASVIYPPVSCGTRRPTCDRPCSRQHSCGHEVLHNCHSEPTCPPCTVLTQRWCHGKHELRKAVPCYVSEISCGLSCNKPISCRRHKCITICHSGACEKPGQQCSQPCTIPRELCGHICAAPCHEDKCPDTSCKEMVKVTCQCGHRTMTRVCAENSKEYQRIASSILASKMADMQLGHSVNLEQVFGQGAKKQNQLKTLECNDECKVIERNRRLALGLQIANPDLSGKLMPRYSDFMKQWAKKDSHFCQMVHDKLTELVQLAKISKQKSRSYSFDCMNKDKRHFIHELCEHFGCESQAYDQEPKRNVVATAVKDKCWLPSYSLLEIVQRKNGQRKVPGPMLNTSKTDGSTKTILSLPTRKTQKSDTLLNIKTPEPEIDYFDYQG